MSKYHGDEEMRESDSLPGPNDVPERRVYSPGLLRTRHLNTLKRMLIIRKDRIGNLKSGNTESFYRAEIGALSFAILELGGNPSDETAKGGANAPVHDGRRDESAGSMGTGKADPDSASEAVRRAREKE